MAYLTTDRGYRDEVAPARFYTVRDASRWNKLALAASALKVLYVVARERPDVVVSTGAAPGYLALRFAKLIGAQTASVDSVANVEKEMSLSGQMASTKADLCLVRQMAAPLGRWRGLGGVGGLIFATVGTQLPFDRMIAALDDWAGSRPGP